MEPILRFYRQEAPDDRGRFLHEIWRWDHEKLEQVHDYIQWLFPTPGRSAFNPGAPVLTPDVITEFQDDETLRARLRHSLETMLGFYGLQPSEGDAAVSISRETNFAERSRNWLSPGNHNLLRLTRILESTRVLGLERYSAALFRALEEIHHSAPGRISAETLRYWKNACGVRWQA